MAFDVRFECVGGDNGRSHVRELPERAARCFVSANQGFSTVGRVMIISVQCAIAKISRVKMSRRVKL
jgi:hypothetical protein